MSRIKYERQQAAHNLRHWGAKLLAESITKWQQGETDVAVTCDRHFETGRLRARAEFKPWLMQGKVTWEYAPWDATPNGAGRYSPYEPISYTKAVSLWLANRLIMIDLATKGD